MMTTWEDSDNMYPRPRWQRVLRWMFRFWYLIFLILPSNMLFNLFQLVETDNWAALSDRRKVTKALLIDKILKLVQQRPLVIGVAITIALVLVVAGRQAHADLMKERQFKDKQQRRVEIDEVSAKAVREVVREERKRVGKEKLPILPPEPPSVEPKGPPHDILTTAEGDFVGRTTELANLLRALRSPGTHPVVFITGIGGIGKTTLAAEAIHDLQYEDAYPDGIGVVLAQDKLNATTVLREALARFDPQRKQPPATTSAELMDAAERLLKERRALVVIDNVEPGIDLAAVLSPLVSAGATVLLTTRAGANTGPSDQEDGRPVLGLPRNLQDASWILPLGLLSHDEAVELFTKESGAGSVRDWSPTQLSAVNSIVASLREHTLAVKLAARYAKDAQVNLTRLAEELSDPQRVTELGGDIETIYHKSRTSLPATAQRLFMRLGAFPTSEFGLRAAQYVASRSGDQDPLATIQLLIRRGLTSARNAAGFAEPADAERLELHPVLYGFARDELEQADASDRNDALRAVADYYARYTTSVYRDALALDETNAQGALEWAHDAHYDEAVARICVGMQAYWRDYGRKAARQRYLPWGVAAAQSLVHSQKGTNAQELLALVKLGNAQFLRLEGKVAEAKSASGGILKAFRKLKNLAGEGSTLVLLANIARDQAEPDVAETHLNQAYRIFTDPRVNDKANAALVLAFRGQIRERMGTRSAEADKDLAASYALYDSIDNAWGRGLALQARGRILLRRGQFSEADDCYSAALAIHQRLQSLRAAAVDISSLGQIAVGRGQFEQAQGLYEQSQAIRSEAGDRRGDAVDLTLRGQLCRIKHEYDMADTLYRSALAIWRAIPEPRGIGWATSEAGQLALAQGHLSAAREFFDEALSLHIKAEDTPAQAVTQRALGDVHLTQNEVREAQTCFDRALRLAANVEDPFTQAQALCRLALCALHTQDIAQARALAEQGLSIAQAGESPLCRAEALAAAAALFAWIEPETTRSADLLEEAEGVYSRLGIPSASPQWAILTKRLV